MASLRRLPSSARPAWAFPQSISGAPREQVEAARALEAQVQNSHKVIPYSVGQRKSQGQTGLKGWRNGLSLFMQSYVVKRPGYREAIIGAICANNASQTVITTIIIILLGSQSAPEPVTFLAWWRKSGKDVN